MRIFLNILWNIGDCGGELKILQESRWLRGIGLDFQKHKPPSGPSLKLLTLVEKNGLAVVT